MRLPGPLTTRVFETLPQALPNVGGAGGSSQLDALLAQDAALQALHQGNWPPLPQSKFVSEIPTLLCSPSGGNNVDVDVAVCGGTLGILLACALQLSGHRVAVIEAGPLRGREQDWNTSMDELLSLVEAGVLLEDELSEVAPLSFGPMRCAFGASPDFELSLSGVLDVAVSPEALLRVVRARFEANGGLVLERCKVNGVDIHADGARVDVLDAAKSAAYGVHCRLVIDCMGHRSPIALQQRNGQKPDGVCVQVGSCASSADFAKWGLSGDFFCTAGDAAAGGPNRRSRVQHFWQAFPTSSADDTERSTYMFTYLKPSPEMPGLLETLEAYWQALPGYQQLASAPASAATPSAVIEPSRGGAVGGGAGEGQGRAGEAHGADGAEEALRGVRVSRVLFGWFPTYRRNAPLRPAFDRVLSIGDASAVQSPISFGGFCAMLRHLPRLRRGVDLALRSDSLTRSDLGRLAPYFPNLGSAWMSSAAMTARAYEGMGGAAPSSSLVNDLLEGNFKVMGSLPRDEALTFFRDVTTLKTLTAVLVGQTLTMAPLLPSVVAELGPLELIEFGGHLGMLAIYTALHAATAVERDASLRDSYTSSAAAAESHAESHAESSGEGEEAGRRVVSVEQFRRSCQLDAWAFGSGLD